MMLFIESSVIIAFVAGLVAFEALRRGGKFIWMHNKTGHRLQVEGEREKQQKRQKKCPKGPVA